MLFYSSFNLFVRSLSLFCGPESRNLFSFSSLDFLYSWFKPLKYPDNEAEIKPIYRSFVTLQQANTASHKSLGCSWELIQAALQWPEVLLTGETAPALCIRATAPANILWHPWVSIPQWFHVNTRARGGSGREELSPDPTEVGAAVSPELRISETSPGWYWNLWIEANSANKNYFLLVTWR